MKIPDESCPHCHSSEVVAFDPHPNHLGCQACGTQWEKKSHADALHGIWKDLPPSVQKDLMKDDPLPQDHKGPWFFVVSQVKTHPSNPAKLQLETRRATSLALANERMDILKSIESKKPEGKRKAFGVIASFDAEGNIFP